ncbi:MAG: ribosome small subunit-dependent GTPase A [Bacteroidales bacterium]|nr:ribosome small subunit-dependent GTPase A [Bacteroidales bacterium]
MEGTVIKSTGSWLKVMTSDGEIFNCKLKGSFRIRGIKTTNPLAVGDRVTFDILDERNIGLISDIQPRSNYIVRKATKLSKVAHILAANIDQAAIVVTLAHPRTSTGFIDRFLVTTEAYHIPATIIFNKLDLYNNKIFDRLKDMIGIYENAGYKCVVVSALKKENLEAVKAILKDKITLLSGHSGVGKSELINAIQPGLYLRTREISEYHQKGLHTTTFAEMLPLSFGGYIIDTPGIKEFGLTDFNRKEISERFPEMRNLMHQCRFSNCTHVHEPGCAIKKAVETGEISFSRYENYLGILEDDYWKETESDYRY